MTPLPHTLYNASAGSGKTFTLTSAYIARLIEGEDPGAILATTFTRAAAGEIHERVLSRLANAATDQAALAELAKSTDHPELTHAQCAAALRDVIDQSHRLSIQTIDAFFGSLAKAFTFELGLSPTWGMIDEHEEDLLREQALEHALEHADTLETLTLLRELNAKRPNPSVLRTLLDHTKRVHELYLASDQDERAFGWITPTGAALEDPAILAAAKTLVAFDPPLTKKNTPRRHWVNAIANAARAAADKDWESFLSVTPIERILLARAQGSHDYGQYDRAEIPEDFARAAAPLIDHAAHALTSDFAARTRATHKLLHRFDQFFMLAKISAGSLSFADPPRLLRRNDITSELGPLYYRLDATLRHVMLDEFQDTSTEQFTLLEPILRELLTHDADQRSVMIVGDEKQSLYAWRGAEPKLMRALEHHWPGALETRTLAKSWRSGPAVLDAVNQVFQDVPTSPMLATPEHARAAASRWSAFPEHKAAKPSKPSAASLVVSDEPNEYENPADALIRSCAQTLASIRRAHPSESAAILVRKTKHIPALLRHLNDLGIKASEDRGNPLLDTPCVAAVYALLAWAAYPNTTAALELVSRSPLGPALRLTPGAPNEHARSRILEHAASGRLPDLLLSLLPSIAPSTDPRGLERYLQLTELAHASQSAHPGDISHLLRAVENTRVEEPATAPVKVMTIHQSKGLEFDHVVLPLTLDTWTLRNDTTLMQRADHLGPVTRIAPYANALMRTLDPELAELHAQMLEKQINEELCCLYVAMTRAATSLTMLTPSVDLHKNPTSDSATHTAAHTVVHALAPDAEPDAFGRTLWRSDHNTELPTKHDDTDKQHDAPAHPVTLPTAHAARTSRLPITAPSSLANAPTRNPFRATDRTAARTGELVHAAFEHTPWITHDTTPDTMLEQALKHTPALAPDPETTDAAREHLSRALASDEIRALLTEPANTRTRVLTEHPFAARVDANGSPSIVQGRIDRLVLTLDDQGAVTHAHVIDFKTGRSTDPEPGSDPDAPQMLAYASAAATMFALDPHSVRATIIRTAPPSLTEIQGP